MEQRLPESAEEISQSDWEKTPESVKRLVMNLIERDEQLGKRVEALEQRYEELKAENQLLKEQLQLAIELMDTAEARKDGYGVMSAEKWRATQKLQVEYGGQKQAVADDKLWTSVFKRLYLGHLPFAELDRVAGMRSKHFQS